MNKILTVGALALTLASCLATPVQAGDQERGILYGVLGTVIISEIAESRRHRNDHNYRHNPYYRSHNGGGFPPFRCSGNEVRCAYERGVWERELQERHDAKSRAYQCGRHPERCQP